MESKKLRLLNSLSFGTLIATVFLSIFFFVPYVTVSLDVSKGFLLSLGVTISIFFWLMARLVDGKFTIPKDRIILFAFFIPCVFFIASFFSSSLYLSFFGRGFEVGTFGMMLVFFLVFFLSSIYFQTDKRMHTVYTALYSGAAVLMLFELGHIFINMNSIFPGMLAGVPFNNLLGTWNNFALFIGGMILLALTTLDFTQVKKAKNVFLSMFILIGLFFLTLVNSSFVWLLVGIFALIIFVYKLSQHREGAGTLRSIPIATFIVVLCSLLFLIGSDSFGGVVAQYFGVSNAEIYPSFSGTINVALHALKHNPVFGTGPNTFLLDWSMWHPTSILATQFWNSDFNSSFGLIPTFLVTTGIMGFMVWMLFFVVYILRGIQSMRVALSNTLASYYILSSLFVSLYFWVAVIFSTPNTICIMVAFVMSGVFLGALVHTKAIQVYDNSFLKDPRMSFFSILALVVLMITAIATCYVYTEKFAAYVYFSNSSPKDSTLASLRDSEISLIKASTLDKNDVYYRALSQVYLAQIQTIVSDKTISPDTMKATVQQLLTNLENTGQQAVAQNPKYYMNWINLGDVYSSLVNLGVTGSYDNSASAYNKAFALTPHNPSILLSLAQLEINHKSNDKAREYINQALAMKPNYTDAIFTLAQIEASEGNLKNAITQAEHAAQVAPGDETVFFRLGMLRYNNTDYSGAVSAFETAVRINPNYYNARYFLALSYQKVGRVDDAKTQLNFLGTIFPDNQDIKNALNGNTTPAVTPAKATDKTKKLPLPEKKS